jgi:hypothetical protein
MVKLVERPDTSKRWVYLDIPADVTILFIDQFHADRHGKDQLRFLIQL